MNRLLVLILSLSVCSLDCYSETQSDNSKELSRIEQSNYFTNGKDVYFVLSNLWNSSGFLCVSSVPSSKKLKVTNKYEECLNNEVFFIEKDDPILHMQNSKMMTVAIKVPGLSLEKVNIVSKVHVTQKQNVYFQFSKIKQADADSFEQVVIPHRNSAYSFDKNNVYLRENILANANPKTFSILEQGYSTDGKFVYNRLGEVLNGADATTFMVLSYTYQKDKKNVWSYGKRIEADAQSFQIVKRKNYYGNHELSLYATDKENIYFQGEIITQADNKSFRLIVSGAPYQTYGIDRNNVYYCGQLIKGADVKTFRVVKEKTKDKHYDAYDRKFKYIRNKREKLNNIK